MVEEDIAAFEHLINKLLTKEERDELIYRLTREDK